MRKVLLVLLVLVVAATPAAAKSVLDLQSTATYTDLLTKQQNFEKLVTDIGMMISYKPVSPAAPLGGTLPGFDVGIEASSTKIEKNQPYWTDAVKPQLFGGDPLDSSQLFTKVHAQIGLPVIDVDLGLVYGTSQSIDAMKFTGAEIKYALLEGGIAMPAVALRASYTKMSGIDVLDVKTYQADISISKGFAFITPYAGIGQVWIKGKAGDTANPAIPGDTAVVLADVSVNETKAFVGAKISLFYIFNLVLEGEFATVDTYSARLNVHF